MCKIKWHFNCVAMCFPAVHRTSPWTTESEGDPLAFCKELEVNALRSFKHQFSLNEVDCNRQIVLKLGHVVATHFLCDRMNLEI